MAVQTIKSLSVEEHEKRTGYSKLRAWYLVAIMAFAFGMAELSHYLVGSTTKLMAQELRYGDKACFQNDRVPGREAANVTCASFNNSIACRSPRTRNGILLCQWNYNGLGIEYQLLAGPSFIFSFSVGGIVIGALADRFNRIVIFAVCTVLFSTSTILMGASHRVWQLIVLRLLIAFGGAACKPISAGLIMDIFPKSMHGAALGVINWGIYFGYGMSLIVGSYIPPLDILGQGWRWAYYLTGIPGFVAAFLMVATTFDPRDRLLRLQLGLDSNQSVSQDSQKPLESSSSEVDSIPPFRLAVCYGLRCFFSPIMLLLCLASCIRQTAGFAWSYNAQLYNETYYPDSSSGLYLCIATVIGGSVGLVMGGCVSDRIVAKFGIHARVWIIVVSQLTAAPCAVGVLLLSPPYSFISLLAAYTFAGMWISILFAVLIEIIPKHLCSLVIGIFLFVMNNVGGNLPVVIDPLSKLIGYREVLYIFYPGGYLLSIAIYAVTAILLGRSHH